MVQLEQQMFEFLRELGLPISKKFLFETVQSHPEYPALTACVDTFEILGVQYQSVVVDDKKLDLIEFPFLAHLNLNGGELKMFSNKSEFTPNIHFDWSGIAIIASAKNFRNHRENKAYYAIERREKVLNQSLLVLISGFFLFIFFANYFKLNYFNASYAILSSIGFIVSYFIIEKELGIENSTTEKLCGVIKETDCNTVINSSGANLFWGLKWSDIGILYFSTTCLVITIAQLTNANLSSLFTYISLAGLPFTVFSLFYQWKIAKSWCVLCLIILCIIWLQAATAFAFGNFKLNLSTLNAILLSLTIFLPIYFIWNKILKPKLFEQNKLKGTNKHLERFKLNIDLYTHHLFNQNQVDIPRHKQHIELGDKTSKIQLVIASNPFCRPCAEAHQELDNIIDYMGDKISLRIIFLINPKNRDDEKVKAVQLIYDTINENGGLENKAALRKILHLWFENRSADKFIESLNQNKLKIRNPNTSEQAFELDKNAFSHSDSWTSSIKYTPTLLINGYQNPKSYSIKEFIKLILPLVNDKTFLRQTEKMLRYT